MGPPESHFPHHSCKPAPYRRNTPEGLKTPSKNQFQGGIATFLTMPLDVMKTRMMNAKPGQYAVSIGHFYPVQYNLASIIQNLQESRSETAITVQTD